jgi:hypothetical protein
MKKIGNKDVLSLFLQEMGEARKEGEKTAIEIYDEAIAAGHDVTIESVRSRLTRLCTMGKLVTRKMTINGTRANLYSEP